MSSDGRVLALGAAALLAAAGTLRGGSRLKTNIVARKDGQIYGTITNLLGGTSSVEVVWDDVPKGSIVSIWWTAEDSWPANTEPKVGDRVRTHPDDQFVYYAGSGSRLKTAAVRRFEVARREDRQGNRLYVVFDVLNDAVARELLVRKERVTDELMFFWSEQPAFERKRLLEAGIWTSHAPVKEHPWDEWARDPKNWLKQGSSLRTVTRKEEELALWSWDGVTRASSLEDAEKLVLRDFERERKRHGVALSIFGWSADNKEHRERNFDSLDMERIPLRILDTPTYWLMRTRIHTDDRGREFIDVDPWWKVEPVEEGKMLLDDRMRFIYKPYIWGRSYRVRKT